MLCACCTDWCGRAVSPLYSQCWLNACLLWQGTGLEYDRYLRQVVEVLESDDGFRKKLETANISDIKVSFLLAAGDGGP